MGYEVTEDLIETAIPYTDTRDHAIDLLEKLVPLIEAQARAEIEEVAKALRQIAAYKVKPSTGASAANHMRAIAQDALDALSRPVSEVCQTCNGHGEVGGFVNADSGYQSEPCPDCASRPVSERQDDGRDWVVRKNGYFYRPNSQGYTVSIFEAGHYTREEAEAHAAASSGEVTAHPASAFIGGPRPGPKEQP